MNEEINKLIAEAIRESDSAANEFENCGTNTYGDVPNGVINFNTALGRAQVDLLRAQLALFKAKMLANSQRD